MNSPASGWLGVGYALIEAAVLVLGSAFALGAWIKTVVWWKSLKWALSRGHDYAEAVQKFKGEVTREDRVRQIREFEGDFIPCGAKSVNLWSPHPTIPQRILDLLFVKTPIFLLEGSLLALFASLMHESNPARLVAVAIATWVCVYSLMLIAEAVVWYVIAKDYARVWGDLKFSNRSRNSSGRTLGDFRGLGAVTVTAVFACSVLISVTAQGADQYENLDPSAPETLGIPTLISSTYYVLATMTTVGDDYIAPKTALARMAAGLLHLMVVLTISFAISAIAARVQDRE
ncbi:ion channel [Actinoplanes sp. Pm04-4]|uniref:Ion channel n=1 Tax=Paractinoplanes pyxinae TaxID=2997416 RepID=A0ABT4BCS9_9ACTN|nr:ion channel [Actinoplanes pyxinae]MCY1144323.1 ion channel [Actinoplanes pyxinae]